MKVRGLGSPGTVSRGGRISSTGMTGRCCRSLHGPCQGAQGVGVRVEVYDRLPILKRDQVRVGWGSRKVGGCLEEARPTTGGGRLGRGGTPTLRAVFLGKPSSGKNGLVFRYPLTSCLGFSLPIGLQARVVLQLQFSFVSAPTTPRASGSYSRTHQMRIIGSASVPVTPNSPGPLENVKCENVKIWYQT